jgi:DNA-binding NarL/FixJ family response regulator
VGGGVTSPERSVAIALDAEFQGALGVVLNQPASNELVEKLKKKLEIPVIVTVVSENEDIQGRIDAGVDIFNVSGAARTEAIVRRIRSMHARIPIIATGGKDEFSILNTIKAGANAITYTPPSAGDLLRTIMNKYRRELDGQGPDRQPKEDQPGEPGAGV